MKMNLICVTLLVFGYLFGLTQTQSPTDSQLVPQSDDYSVVHRDGSYQFGYANRDRGSSYHFSEANSRNVVRGRFGSRNPGTGRIDETQYSSGPRGFRPRGPNVHRKYDLNQNAPLKPIGNREDPYFDPNEDPSYSFGFRSSNHNRQESADRNGDVTGRYSFIDDVGERHNVEYIAGKKIGFHVKTPFPDSNPRAYGPLYYSGPGKKPRGHTSIQRGLDGSYRFVAAGPDQRRTETSDSAGNVRGSYTYLDNKGKQHSVHYIAGANIGYRVLKNPKDYPTVFPFSQNPPFNIPDSFDGPLGTVSPTPLDDIFFGHDENLNTAASGHIKPTKPPTTFGSKLPIDKTDPFGDANDANDLPDINNEDIFGNRRPGSPPRPKTGSGSRPGSGVRPSPPVPSGPGLDFGFGDLGFGPSNGPKPTQPTKKPFIPSSGDDIFGGGGGGGSVGPTIGFDKGNSYGNDDDNNDDLFGNKGNDFNKKPDKGNKPTKFPVRPLDDDLFDSFVPSGPKRPSPGRPRPGESFYGSNKPSGGSDDDIFGGGPRPTSTFRPSKPTTPRPVISDDIFGSNAGFPTDSGFGSTKPGRPVSDDDLFGPNSGGFKPNKRPGSDKRPEVSFRPDDDIFTNDNDFGGKPDKRPTLGGGFDHHGSNNEEGLDIFDDNKDKSGGDSWTAQNQKSGKKPMFRVLSTIFRNVGDKHITFPPGVAVRAHVQSIDILPFGSRLPSPGDQLEKDSKPKSR